MPRFFAPDVPLHVIQRGNDRAPIFAEPHDLRFFRACLLRASREHGVAIHAYVLMTNHVHLLATPRQATSMPKMMQSIGRVYVQYFNATYRRSGTLWEGRYRAAIVDDEHYLLTCMRYIELNPVRAQMVASPGQFLWSSVRANACGAADDLVEPHSIYRQLGCSPEARQAAYRELLRSSISEEVLCAIRDATHECVRHWGSASSKQCGGVDRRAERLPMGRPRKERCRGRQSRV